MDTDRVTVAVSDPVTGTAGAAVFYNRSTFKYETPHDNSKKLQWYNTVP